jgi:Pathogenicity locus
MTPSTAVQRTSTRHYVLSKDRTGDTLGLRDLRGVGPSIEADLRQLGVGSVSELSRRDGHALYEALCDITRTRQDPCVLDTFVCAVAQARNPELPEEQRNWWWWSRQRKAAQLH